MNGTDTVLKSGGREAGTERYRWVILALNTGVQATHACVTTSVGALAPFLVADLAITKAMLGMAGGGINFGMAFTALLAGYLADKKGERAVLVTGSVLTGLAAILTSQAKSFPVFLMLLVLTGAAASSPTPAGSKAIQHWFPAEKLGLALGIRQTGIPIGGFIGALILPFLAAYWGWSLALSIAGLFVIASGAVYYIMYKEAPGRKAVSTDNLQSGSDSGWYFVRNKSIWYGIVMSIIFLGAQFVMLTYFVLYLHDQVGLSVPVASLCLATTQLAGMAARIILGFVSDNFMKGARKPALIGLGAILIATLLLLAFYGSKMPFWVVLIISWFFGVSAMGWNGIFIALVVKLAGKEQSGVAVGFCITVMQIGVLLFPPMFGYLIDLTGSYQISWLMMALSVIIGTVVLTRVDEPTM